MCLGLIDKVDDQFKQGKSIKKVQAIVDLRITCHNKLLF